MALAAAFGTEASDLYRVDPPETVDFMFLRRITSGNSLLDRLERATAMSYEADDLRDHEISSVREFIETLNVWALIWRDKEPAESAAARYALTSILKQLDSKGLWVFAGPTCSAAPEGAPATPLKIAIIRSDNPRIAQPRALRQLGNEMCAIVTDAAPRTLDSRVLNSTS
jgi:hypothetical protein